MCGRFALAFTKDVIIEALNGGDWFEYRYPLVLPRYNVAPLQFAPVLWKEEKRVMVDAFRWGLIPKWAKDESFASRMINARIESLREKPAYKNLLTYHRGVVLTSGYFEWKKTASGKQPWYIKASDSPILPLAGLWDVWNTPDQSPLYTFTVITTDARDDLAHIHNRMPVLLKTDQLQSWIEGDLSPDMLKEPVLKTHPLKVSSVVNNSRNDIPQCIQGV
jgi:putative SOS response-associated peptidase YedK